MHFSASQNFPKEEKFKTIPFIKKTIEKNYLVLGENNFPREKKTIATELDLEKRAFYKCKSQKVYWREYTTIHMRDAV